MKLLRSARALFLALALCAVPAVSSAGVLISVAIAPPALPVYVQRPCPQPGWMWTPGYWAYGPDGYYWVPGAWVPAPYVGALWTPGYWGWSSNMYIWHTGYWGRHVGYYGGINYGFGYMGVGFVGGAWRGHNFAYNTAVVRVDNVHVRNVYVDRTVVERNTIRNDRHVAFNGGPGGIDHRPGAQERALPRDQRMQPTQSQTQHMQAARNDRSAYYKSNNGQPHTMATERPMTAQPGNGQPNGGRGPSNQPRSYQPAPRNQGRPPVQPQAQPRGNQGRPMSQPQAQPRGNPRGGERVQQPRPQSRPEPHGRDRH